MKALIATSLGNIKVDNFEVPNKGNNILAVDEDRNLYIKDSANNSMYPNNFKANPSNNIKKYVCYIDSGCKRKK